MALPSLGVVDNSWVTVGDASTHKEEHCLCACSPLEVAFEQGRLAGAPSCQMLLALQAFAAYFKPLR